ncbi:MAG TPA: PTS lactose/cellobiose transporter subunit IIA [Pseudoflavonifractor sp.]|jgi:PTS system cellobiose-specific IIA component|nr:PTS lactose/cellobiose transporter subunit IIA [Pseudoflavonifractor sp.]
MIQDEKFQEIAMTIIANAGASKGAAFGALEEARAGHYDQAEALLKDADAALSEAQKGHRELLTLDAQNLVPQVDILLTHCQDHFMMAALAKDLVTELVRMYRLINNK